MGIWKWIQKNSAAITPIAAVITLLSLTGFNINIPEFYHNLSIENKILFVLLFNTLVSLILFSISLSKKK